MPILLIGIDDTDHAASRGTGYLARQLSAACAARGLRACGVTRHQFLVDPRIPYTSHNSGACVAVEAGGGADAASFAADFIRERAARGSDPGLCIAPADAVSAAVMAFGRRATAEVVSMDEARGLARAAGLVLEPLGGTGLGVIGALGSVGLRAEGGDGRFIDLEGLRDLADRVTVADVGRLAIRVEPCGERRPAPEDPLETLRWVRPRLLGGRPVLVVEWSPKHDAWIPVDRRHESPAG